MDNRREKAHTTNPIWSAAAICDTSLTRLTGSTFVSMVAHVYTPIRQNRNPERPLDLFHSLRAILALREYPLRGLQMPPMRRTLCERALKK